MTEKEVVEKLQYFKESIKELVSIIKSNQALLLEKDAIIENLTKELECSNNNEVLNTKSLSEKDDIIESLNKEIDSLRSEKESVESNLNKVIEEMTKTLEEKDNIINENKILNDNLKKPNFKEDDIKSIDVNTVPCFTSRLSKFKYSFCKCNTCTLYFFFRKSCFDCII